MQQYYLVHLYDYVLLRLYEESSQIIVIHRYIFNLISILGDAYYLKCLN